MTKRVEVSKQLFKDVYLGKVKRSSLTKEQRIAYDIFYWGCEIGREIAILEAVSKIDPEMGNELTGKFVGELIEEAKNASDED